ncbi:MAG: N-acetylmuramoyl-L-alanine amidase [Deferribacteres bacterium]|nr:N-acetylmuramoyl-L-alanine amidase [candidate division KSB1 bacterium]MCB9503974.1 N-acetylmuramoyl-L-alanine amidase [Deferribacteres bacterium]
MKNNKLSHPFHTHWLLFLFLLILIYPNSTFAQAKKTAVLLDGNYRELPTVRLNQAPQFEFVAIRELAEILDTFPIVSKKTRKAMLHLGDIEVKVTAFNPFVMLNNDAYQMPVQTEYDDGEIYVPVPFFIDLIAPAYSGNLVSIENQKYAALDADPPVILEAENSASATLAAKADNFESVTNNETMPKDAKSVPEVTGIFVDEKANGTLIRVKTSAIIPESHVNLRSTRGWLYIDIFDSKVDTLRVDKQNNSQFIREIVPVQLPQMAQLSFRFAGTLDSKKLFSNVRNSELLISLTTRKQISADIIKTLENERKKWLIDTIILDPGHGGRDPGAIGPSGIYEKNVTLAIARHLKKLIEDETDIRVVMTRQTDHFVSLKERTQLANKEQGKLFISIHANSNRSRRVTGLSTYLLGAARTEEAIESARRENSVIRYEADSLSYADFDAENYILASMAQNSYQRESEQLAAFIQDEISDRTSAKNRGVKQAGYYVLIGASMPNVLVETGFISNRTEEKKLNSYQFQKKIAQGIFEGILQFKKKYESGI